MTFDAMLEDADGAELAPALRASIDYGRKGWHGSLVFPPGKTEGVLRVLNDAADPNYYYRLVASDGRIARIQFAGRKSVGMSGVVTIEFVADGPLEGPPADE